MAERITEQRLPMIGVHATETPASPDGERLAYQSMTLEAIRADVLRSERSNDRLWRELQRELTAIADRSQDANDKLVSKIDELTSVMKDLTVAIMARIPKRRA